MKACNFWKIVSVNLRVSLHSVWLIHSHCLWITFSILFSLRFRSLHIAYTVCMCVRAFLFHFILHFKDFDQKNRKGTDHRMAHQLDYHIFSWINGSTVYRNCVASQRVWEYLSGKPYIAKPLVNLLWIFPFFDWEKKNPCLQKMIYS